MSTALYTLSDSGGITSRFFSYKARILAVVVLILTGFSSVWSQTYTQIPGFAGGERMGSYTYVYNYPQASYYIYGLYTLYDYYNKGYDEFVVLASDMKAAGLCSGPITGMSMRFLVNPRSYTGTFRVFMRNIGSNYLNRYNGSVPGGYPYYYTRCIQRSGTTITAQAAGEGLPAAVEVMNTNSWNLPVIALNDTTDVYYEFNTANQFVWDGTSNIAIGVLNCRPNTTNGAPNGSISQYVITEVNPPPGGTSYYSYPPWFQAFYYYYYTAPNDCDDIYYSATFPYLYWYTYDPAYAYQYRWFRPWIGLRVGTGVTQSFPDDVDPRRILRSGDVYDGSTGRPKPSFSYYEATGKQYTVSYRITGPEPSTSTVYQATWSGNPSLTFTGTTTGPKTITMTGATGTLARSDGSLDLTNAVGGSYRVHVSITTSDCGTQTWNKPFIVAFQNDVAMAMIRSPQPSPKKNPLNVALPLSCQLQNVGLSDVTSVDVTAVIKTYPGGQVVYSGTTNWSGTLTTGERAVVDFTGTAFTPTVVGKYTAEFCATLKNAVDMQTFNDCIPTPGQTHIFEVNYNQEGGAYLVNIPSATGQYFANRPFQPMGTIQNNGILDGSNWPVQLEIFRLPGLQRVYNETVILPSIDAAAPGNFATTVFPLFTPDQAGTYRACMTLKTNDPNPDNDQICQDFTVLGNLEGTYTIGLANSGKPRNYATIELAVNDLYLRGVSGAVTFELTDENYTLTATPNTGGVALDLTGYIPGMSSTNTVTFKPNLERSLTRGSITINMSSLNGIGVLFGQNLTPSNQQSLAQQFPTVRAYSNSAGNFIFDGGSQKSIRVNLIATTPFRAPFYLGDGSQSIKLKNMIIGNGSGVTPSYATSLPRVYFTNGQFTFESDVRTVSGNTFTYSSGIVDRNKMPVGITGNNSERLDTITGHDNEYSGNEISGFGYGIVSLGIGTLLKGGVNEFRPYYSTNTKIKNNVISGVCRAGIVAGYQDGLEVSGNRIYNVGTTVSNIDDAMGILLGGTSQYNVMNSRVSNNEISGVRGTAMSRGIVVDQVRNSYQSVSASGGMYYAPAGAEKTMVSSNVVWGLSRGSTSGGMAGIHLQTGRSSGSLTTPLSSDYFTRQDVIANNTVVMSSDNVVGSGPVVGIGVQHGNGTVLMNNAIAMQGASNASSMAHCAVLYQGTTFRGGSANTWYLSSTAPAALQSNRNAYYAPNASIAHMVEISASSEIISAGAIDEYRTIDQWRSTTGQDINSVVGNFVAEHEFQGVAPAQKLRVKVTPQAPIGSILNNRGERIEAITTDIDGNARGEAGLGYDIGADEFDGRMYVSDLEAIDILSPKSYRSSTGATSEAEYIMTTAPVDVTARIRNNGGLPRTGAGIRVRIWVETPASNNGNLATPVWSPNPIVDRTYTINLNSGQSTDVVFGIQGFTPQSYQQMPAYTVPARFAAMSLNVTPRYFIEVTTPNDENNANNTVSKVVRFFVKRSLMSIIVSGRYTGTDLGTGSNSTTIAGRLNSDTLLKALNDLGFYNNPATQMFAYDVMDRAAWEPRAIDYTMYRTMFWSHDQTAFTRSERDDIRNFVDAGTPLNKKNLAIGSQEPVRRHVGLTIAADENFVRTVLRATNQAPGQPATPNYHNKKVVGRAIARNSEENVQNTTYAGDASPVPALMKLYSDATTPGIALAAYSYKKGDRTTTDSIAGTATASLNSNRVYVGIDWRHFGRAGAFTGAERVLRGIIDFFETNGGTVVPVELMSFDARGRGSDVDVFWSTASEQNADHFTVERAVADMAKAGDDASVTWNTVATVSAAGNSTERRDYSVVDRNLADGIYQYRLAMVDRDGSMQRTGIVEVVIGSNSEAIAIESVQPNPVRNTGTVNIRLAEAGTVRLTLVDVDGRTVATLFDGGMPSGITPVNIEAARLASGVYTLVANVEGMVATATVTIAK